MGRGVATEKKPVPNLKFAAAFGFFGFFFGLFFVFFCGTFSVFFGLNFDKKFQPFKNHVNNVVLGCQELPNNTLNAYRALGNEKKKRKKKTEKPVPNLKFAVAFVFLGCNYPSGVKIGAL